MTSVAPGQLEFRFDEQPRYDLCGVGPTDLCPRARGRCCRELEWEAAGRPQPVPYGVIPF